MEYTFSFDDDTDDVLGKAGKVRKKAGRPTKPAAEKRDNKITTYLTASEFAEFEESLKGVPPSIHLRAYITEFIKENKRKNNE